MNAHTKKIALSVVAVLVALIWVFPVYWMVNSSFVPTIDLLSFIPTFFPINGTLTNFTGALADGQFFSALGMSVAVTLTVVFFCIIFAFLAAVAISRFRFRGRKSFVIAVLLVQMLPAEGLFIAQYKMISSVGLLDSVLGVSIIYIASVVPFTIWMLRGFVAGIPIDLEEAAMVDGLSRTGAFMRITFPLLAPGSWPPASMLFFRLGTSSRSPSSPCPQRLHTRCRSGCADSFRRAQRARPTGVK